MTILVSGHDNLTPYMCCMFSSKELKGAERRNFVCLREGLVLSNHGKQGNFPGCRKGFGEGGSSGFEIVEKSYNYSFGCGL